MLTSATSLCECSERSATLDRERLARESPNARERRSDGPDLIGQMAGEYRIGRKLGAGGFGTVYEAVHPLLQRRAAVKVLHSSPDMNSVAVQRFIAEARSASQIRHLNIVDIFSFGTLPNGQYFYVMDLLEGAPLDRYLREYGKLAPEFMLALLRPVAAAIDALHSASLVHRDIKPANIFLAWDSHGDVVPKLLDFGLVKLLGDVSVNTTTGAPLGTPYYMSPEQCQGHRVDGRADIYSLGVICFELLTGSVPFTGDSATAVLLAHVLTPPPRMSDLGANVPAELDEPVQRMMAKDPGERPNSAGAAVAALEQAAASAGIVRSELSALPRPTQPPAAELTQLEAEATVAQSGLRPGSLVTTAGPRPTRWLWLAIGPLVIAAWFAGVYREPSSAPTTPQIEPAVVAPPAAAVPPPLAPEPVPEPAAEPQPSAAAALEPAPPPPVAIRVRNAPPGAEVWLNDTKLGAAGEPLLVPYGESPVELTVKSHGRPPRTLRVTPDAAAEVSLPPDRPRAPAKRTTLSSDLENPF